MGRIELYVPLKAESFLWLAAERRIRETGSRRIIWLTLADLKVEGTTEKECRQPLEAESGALLTAGKEMPPPPCYRHKELDWWPEWTWKRILTQSLEVRVQLAQYIDFGLMRSRAENPGKPTQILTTEIWATEWVLFEASSNINLTC